MRHDRFGASAERSRKLLDQLEMQLEELEITTAENEASASDASSEPLAMRLLRYREVRAKGVPWSMTHLARLQDRGEFPRRIHLGTRTVCWTEQDIDQWMADRLVQHGAAIPKLAER